MLRPLAPVLSREADALLDLREALVHQGHPGTCVRCFFQLFEAAEGDFEKQFEPLRNWLEANVEISISAKAEVLETFPLVLEHRDLASFCQQSITTVRMDRGYPHPELRLQFQYKSAA